MLLSFFLKTINQFSPKAEAVRMWKAAQQEKEKQKLLQRKASSIVGTKSVYFSVVTTHPFVQR